MEEITLALQKLANALCEVWEAIKNVLTRVINVLINSYPNRRVIHLAKHGKNARVRKKNIKRIIERS